MPLHHDESPFLSLEQQTEALRLAARLQARHEEAASMEGMFRAAEEAGIERRFLDEAVAQVAASPSPERVSARRAHHPAAGLALAATMLVLAALWPYAPALTGVAMFGFLVALFPTLAGRPRRWIVAWVVGAWILVNAAMWATGVDVRGEFTSVGLLELAGTILGVALAELAAATRAPQERGADRPQSL